MIRFIIHLSERERQLAKTRSSACRDLTSWHQPRGSLSAVHTSYVRSNSTRSLQLMQLGSNSFNDASSSTQAVDLNRSSRWKWKDRISGNSPGSARLENQWSGALRGKVMLRRCPRLQTQDSCTLPVDGLSFGRRYCCTTVYSYVLRTHLRFFIPLDAYEKLIIIRGCLIQVTRCLILIMTIKYKLIAKLIV